MVLNTFSEDKARRILAPLVIDSQIEFEKFLDEEAAKAEIKVYFHQKLYHNWPHALAEALRTSQSIGQPSETYVHPERDAAFGTIRKPSMIGVKWAEWRIE
jgi:hypothetical protein